MQVVFVKQSFLKRDKKSHQQRAALKGKRGEGYASILSQTPRESTTKSHPVIS